MTAGQHRVSAFCDCPACRDAKAIGSVLAEAQRRMASARSSLSAVLHQLEHGEASQFIEGAEADVQASVRDLCWCRDEIKSALKNLS